MSEPNLLQSQTEEIKQHIEKMDRRMDKSGWLVITLSFIVLFICIYLVMYFFGIANHDSQETFPELQGQVEQLELRVGELEGQIEKLTNLIEE